MLLFKIDLFCFPINASARHSVIKGFELKFKKKEFKKKEKNQAHQKSQ
jgi:hypothetical protein